MNLATLTKITFATVALSMVAFADATTKSPLRSTDRFRFAMRPTSPLVIPLSTSPTPARTATTCLDPDTAPPEGISALTFMRFRPTSR